MKQASRAIIIRDNKLLVMKRNKFGSHYYCLIGGGVDIHETPEQALKREVKEETGLNVEKYQLVFKEEAGEPYGTQYVYVCDDSGGEVKLQDDTVEAWLNKAGNNTYEPVWLPLEKLPTSEFRSSKIKQAILDGIKDGFPNSTVEL